MGPVQVGAWPKRVLVWGQGTCSISTCDAGGISLVVVLGGALSFSALCIVTLVWMRMFSRVSCAS